MKTIKYVFLAFFIAILLLTIIWIKGYTFSGFGIVYFYTISITTFMASRIVGSFFYKNPSEIDYNYNPKITFIIPCKNEEKVIFKTIESCVLVDYPKDKIEIIAINDGSTDNTLSEMLRAKRKHKNKKIIIENWKINKGKREGMTFGFKKAKGEIVIQLDSDSFPDSKTIRYLITPFKDKKIYAVVGHTEPFNKDVNIMTKMQTAYYFMSFRALKATESIFNVVFCCSGCYSAYRKEYVLPILKDWNKETFLGKKVIFGDDRALTNQGLKRGYKTVYSSEALAYTIVPETLKIFFKQQRRWKQGWFINSLKASKWIFKRDAFVSLTYFFPLIAITLATPIIAFKALIINPIFLGIVPTFYILGILVVSLLCYAHYQYYQGGKYGKYMLLWSILNMTVISYILIFALWNLFVTKNMGWNTR